MQSIVWAGVAMAGILLSLSGCAANGPRENIPPDLLDSASRRYVLLRLDCGMCWTCQHGMVRLVNEESRANDGLVRVIGVVAVDRPAELVVARRRFAAMDTIIAEPEGLWDATDGGDMVLAVVADSLGVITRRLLDNGTIR